MSHKSNVILDEKQLPILKWRFHLQAKHAKKLLRFGYQVITIQLHNLKQIYQLKLKGD